MTDARFSTVRYGRVLNDTWKGLWKSPGLWGLVGSGWIAMAVLAGIAFGTAWAAGLFDVSTDAPESLLLMWFGLFGTMTVVYLVGGLAYVGIHGGAAHMANEVLEGRKPTFAEGLRVGFGRWLSIFGFEFLFGVTIAAMWLAVMTVFVVVITALAAGGGEATLPFVLLATCCLYLVILIGTPLLATVLVTFEAVGVRNVIVAKTGAWAGYRGAWAAIRHAFRQMFLMGLLYLGLMWVYQMLTSVITSPLSLLFMGDYFRTLMDVTSSGEVADPEVVVASMYSSMGGMYAVLIPVSLLLMWPLMTFTYLLMGAFYRQLTGVDVVPEPTQPPVPVAPGPTPGLDATPSPPQAPRTPESPQPGLPAPPPAAPPPPEPTPDERESAQEMGTDTEEEFWEL